MEQTIAIATRALLCPDGVYPFRRGVEVEVLERLLEEVRRIDGQPSTTATISDAARIDQIGLLERLKAVAGAAQARLAEAFDRSQRAEQDSAGVQARHRGRGIADQVALAAGLPASQGSRRLGFAQALVREMPHTHALLDTGEISEWVATVLVRETACLDLEHRREVDARLCALSADPATGELRPIPIVGMTPRRVEQAAKALAAELDPAAVVRRNAKAERDRRVSLRPAPDTMTHLTGLLPVVQGVAVYAALKRSARAARATGDQRGEGQLMADLLVERVTGQASAAAVPVEIGLVMTPDSLVGLSEQAARFEDGTVLPAATARALAMSTDAPRWLRRVFVDPVTGVVSGRDPRRRRFTGLLAQLLLARDQTCRHPGCQAAVGHLDHVRGVAAGGRTTVENGQGLCVRHNLVKEVPGWRAAVIDDRPGHHTVATSTPTGHTYRSHAPPVLPDT